MPRRPRRTAGRVRQRRRQPVWGRRPTEAMPSRRGPTDRIGLWRPPEAASLGEPRRDAEAAENSLPPARAAASRVLSMTTDSVGGEKRLPVAAPPPIGSPRPRATPASRRGG